MNRRELGLGVLAGAGLLAGAAVAVSWAQSGPQRIGQAEVGDFSSEPLSPFEEAFLRRQRADGVLHLDEDVGPASGKARGLRLEGGRAAIVGLTVRGRKYGISLDGTNDVLIKNYRFIDRQSDDRFGAGLILGQLRGTRGQTWLSNAWIDLKERGPEPDYNKANNEAISVERSNGPLNIRRAVLIGAADAGIDNKGDVRMDASFVASGHRALRVWSGASVTLANTIVLAIPGHVGFWFGGGEGIANVEYYNCRFGRAGDREDSLTDEIPDWMISRDEDDPVEIRIQRHGRDPFDRNASGFWVPAEAPVPRGFLSGRQ